jgi:hypothetical protein
MRMKFLSTATVVGLLILTSARVEAQTSASGRAYGTSLDLGTTPLIDPPASDTGTQTAPPDFDETASTVVIDQLDPVADVVAGPSRTRSCTNESGCPGAPTNATGRQYVLSEAHTDSVEVLVGQASGKDVLDVDDANSTAEVFCPASGGLSTVGTAHIDLLVIGGNPVPVPGDLNPNTTILAPQFPLLVLNEQACPDKDAPAGTTRCSVNAVHAEVLPAVAVPGAQLLDLKVAHSEASLTNASCPGGGGDQCNPNLTNSVKTSQILQQDRTTPKTQQIPAANDPIRFTISAINSTALSDSCPAGSQTGHNLRVIDRIPIGITVDPLSITIQTDDGPLVPTTGTIAPCDGDLQFTGC